MPVNLERRRWEVETNKEDRVVNKQNTEFFPLNIGLIANNKSLEDLQLGQVQQDGNWTKIINNNTKVWLLSFEKAIPATEIVFDFLVVCVPYSAGGRTVPENYRIQLKLAESLVGPERVGILFTYNGILPPREDILVSARKELSDMTRVQIWESTEVIKFGSEFELESKLLGSLCTLLGSSRFVGSSKKSQLSRSFLYVLISLLFLIVAGYFGAIYVEGENLQETLTVCNLKAAQLQETVDDYDKKIANLQNQVDAATHSYVDLQNQLDAVTHSYVECKEYTDICEKDKEACCTTIPYLCKVAAAYVLMKTNIYC